MPKKLLRKLAGYIVIELACALAGFAADFDYKAGYASYGHARALALEDRRGQRAVLVTATFSIPLSVADAIAADAIKQYNLERPNILIHSVASGDAIPSDAITAMGAAVGRLQESFLLYGNGRLTVSSHDGHCLVALSADAALDSCTTPVGDSVGGFIRSALRMVDLAQGLQTRERTPRSVAVQTLAIGPVVIFSGPSNVAQSGRRIILAVTPAVESSPQLTAAVGQVFLRVGGRPH